MVCYKFGVKGHIAINCRNMKCFECGQSSHISTFCPSKHDRVRCAECGRFGHRKEDCNMGNNEKRVSTEGRKFKCDQCEECGGGSIKRRK
ncbi:CCHC-type zinc finger nucleic acid binding protein-like [Gordionus sp. m RMFG-2023]|uniref:CCHC-type zinc finger nucleic acid binding protein-like n=1 Tax=Gordionus sp. m RMFG-2023 TaxID=3053472 RepID=UPI0031FDDF71